MIVNIYLILTSARTTGKDHSGKATGDYYIHERMCRVADIPFDSNRLIKRYYLRSHVFIYGQSIVS